MKHHQSASSTTPAKQPAAPLDLRTIHLTRKFPHIRASQRGKATVDEPARARPAVHCSGANSCCSPFRFESLPPHPTPRPPPRPVTRFQLSGVGSLPLRISFPLFLCFSLSLCVSLRVVCSRLTTFLAACLVRPTTRPSWPCRRRTFASPIRPHVTLLL